MTYRRPALALLTAAGLAVLFAGYLRLSSTVMVGSDGGTITLQAWDMLHGNVLLHGWALSDVSFYTTELPEYALVVRLNGLSPEVVHIAGALTYTILVLLAALVAKGKSTGREGTARVLIAAGIMLAPAPGFGTSTLLLSPDHYGSTVPVLLAWLVVDRCSASSSGGKPSPRTPLGYVPVAVGAILAWGLVADPLVEVTGVTPLVLVCGIRAAQRARRSEPWAWEVSLAVAAIAAIGVSALVSLLIHAAGGFVTSPVQTGFAGFAALPHNAFLAGQGFLLLFGASFIGGQPANMLFSVLHLAGVGLVAAALVVGLGRLFRREDLCWPAGGRPPAPPENLVVPLLATGIVLNIALYVVGRYPMDPLSTREISAVLPLGAALAGQVLAAPLLRARIFPVLGAVVLTGYALSLAVYSSQPRVPALHQDLAGWLVAQHLTAGLATSYWLANITTVDSGGQARVRWVSALDGAVTRPPEWETRAQWYEPGTNSADFLVTDATPGSAAWRSALAAARGTFGQPVSIRRYRQYTVISWKHNVLPFLH